MAEAINNPVIPCLVYHRFHSGVGPSSDYLKAFSMDIGIFREHLEALSEAGYTTGTLDDLFAWQEGSKPVPQKPLLISFDDGWASNYSLAFPQLTRMKMKWSVFVVVELQAHVFSEGEDIDRRLSDEEIVELSDAGVSIQSHGMTHQPFTEIPNEDIAWEAIESKKQLEGLVQKPVEWFCAPYGLSNRRVEGIIKKAGYRGYAPGPIGASRLMDSPFKLRRIGPPPHFSAEQLMERLSPRWLRQAAIRGNIQRRIRLILGFERSKKLRAFMRGRIAW